MDKKVFKQLLAMAGILTTLFMLFTTIKNATATSTEQNKSPVETEESTILDNYVEITQEDAIKLVQNDDIKMVSKGLGVLYIVTNDGKEYKIDGNSELESYLRLHQIDMPITTIVLDNMEESESSPQLSMWDGLFAISAILLLIAFAKRVGVSSNENAVTAGGEESKKGGIFKVNGDEEEEIPTVKFDDVEGIDELKQDIFRLVNCLKNTDKYKRMGARIPKGVILYGPPGTGKTLIAKAIAGEANVPFFSAVGSDFVEKYVGVGAKRVRELYKKARKAAPCIVFIDEIDAVAGKRSDDSNSEKDQTINALLAELDGFSTSKGIITICATNRLDLLDSAFKRAGRFDLKLAVGLPDRNSRCKILEIHGKNKRFAENVNFETIADKTIGFSGAELEALLNEAALLATDKEQEYITNENIDDAFFKIVMQGNKKSRSEITRIQYITAYHEAGHTLATKLLTNDKVPSVTIVQSSSGAGGVTFRAPEENGLKSKEYLRSLIKVMYAGRAAEEVYLGDEDSITTGASNDIKQATSIIKEYLGLYGMGDKGMLDITQFSRDFKDILDEASVLAKELYQETLDLLIKNKTKLEAIAHALVEKETLVEKEIDALIA